MVLRPDGVTKTVAFSITEDGVSTWQLERICLFHDEHQFRVCNNGDTIEQRLRDHAAESNYEFVRIETIEDVDAGIDQIQIDFRQCT